jgi:hypothetical protein
VKLPKSPRSWTTTSHAVSYNSRAVLLALFGLVFFILIVYFASVMMIQPKNEIQFLSTVFIGAISGALALGGTLISQLWGKEDTSSPSIYMTIPPNEGKDIPIEIREIKASFDRSMDESTVNENTFTLKENNGEKNEKPEKVYLDGGNAILKLAAPLTPSTIYIAKITRDAKDITGNSLANDFSWTFTTRS